jgi:hypothetical protein
MQPEIEIPFRGNSKTSKQTVKADGTFATRSK